ncbi:hypothetical protein HOF92_15010 [bacterium]|jgi:hypothetical protein|nr:hypothetical protein [bacterium]
METQESKLKIVDDVWTEFLNEFQTGDLVHDQIFIVSDNMLLRGPNFDLMQLFGLEDHIQ